MPDHDTESVCELGGPQSPNAAAGGAAVLCLIPLALPPCSTLDPTRTVGAFFRLVCSPPPPADSPSRNSKNAGMAPAGPLYSPRAVESALLMVRAAAVQPAAPLSPATALPAAAQHLHACLCPLLQAAAALASKNAKLDELQERLVCLSSLDAEGRPHATEEQREEEGTVGVQATAGDSSEQPPAELAAVRQRLAAAEGLLAAERSQRLAVKAQLAAVKQQLAEAVAAQVGAGLARGTGSRDASTHQSECCPLHCPACSGLFPSD